VRFLSSEWRECYFCCYFWLVLDSKYLVVLLVLHLQMEETLLQNKEIRICFPD
jgi:hypothetical protein